MIMLRLIAGYVPAGYVVMRGPGLDAGFRYGIRAYAGTAWDYLPYEKYIVHTHGAGWFLPHTKGS